MLRHGSPRVAGMSGCPRQPQGLTLAIRPKAAVRVPQSTIDVPADQQTELPEQPRRHIHPALSGGNTNDSASAAAQTRTTANCRVESRAPCRRRAAAPCDASTAPTTPTVSAISHRIRAAPDRVGVADAGWHRRVAQERHEPQPEGGRAAERP